MPPTLDRGGLRTASANTARRCCGVICAKASRKYSSRTAFFCFPRQANTSCSSTGALLRETASGRNGPHRTSPRWFRSLEVLVEELDRQPVGALLVLAAPAVAGLVEDHQFLRHPGLVQRRVQGA